MRPTKGNMLVKRVEGPGEFHWPEGAQKLILPEHKHKSPWAVVVAKGDDVELELGDVILMQAWGGTDLMLELDGKMTQLINLKMEHVLARIDIIA